MQSIQLQVINPILNEYINQSYLPIVPFTLGKE